MQQDLFTPALHRSPRLPGAGLAVRLAQGLPERERASVLLQQRYRERGYAVDAQQAEADLVVLHAEDEFGETTGTLGVRFDGETGLKADQVFPAEMAEIRARGLRVCEFTQLALQEGQEASESLLAGLFHSAYLQAYRLRGVQCVVIEVNPRHAAYYRRMLGFELCGSLRVCPRVGAPAVLMRLDLAHAERQIAALAGRGAQRPAGRSRSLYPSFFGPEEEARQLQRLRLAGFLSPAVGHA